MATIWSSIVAIVSLLSSFFSWLSANQQRQAGEAEATAAQEKVDLDAIAKAKAAGDAAGSDFDANGVRPNDPNLRN